MSLESLGDDESLPTNIETLSGGKGYISHDGMNDGRCELQPSEDGWIVRKGHHNHRFFLYHGISTLNVNPPAVSLSQVPFS